MSERLFPRYFLFFVPFVGYFLYAYAYKKENHDVSSPSFVVNLFENTLLYFLVGIYASSRGFGFSTVLVGAGIVWVMILLLELVLIRKWGHIFPRFLEWWRLQKLPRTNLIVDGAFYGLQTYAFFVVGFLIYRIFF